MDTNKLPKQALKYKPKSTTICTERTNRLSKQALIFKTKFAIKCTEDGHKQTKKTNNTKQTGICYNMYRRWTETEHQNKHYNANQKWLQHIKRMDTNRLPKKAIQYDTKVAETYTEIGQNKH